MIVKQEFNDAGGHRIGVSHKVKGDMTKDAPMKYGPWAGYQQIARCGAYYGTSDYYKGVLPPLFKVIEAK